MTKATSNAREITLDPSDGIASLSSPQIRALLGDLNTQRARLEASGLFDERFYTENIQHIPLGTLSPIDHFLTQGWRSGLKPNFYFDADWYLSNTPDAASFGPAAIFHYMSIGDLRGRNPSPLFETDWYRNRYKISLSENALAHFLKHNRENQYNPLPGFDVGFYVKTYADVLASGMDPFEHFIVFGGSENRRPSAKFDTASYRTRNTGEDLSEHPFLRYVASGALQSDNLTDQETLTATDLLQETLVQSTKDELSSESSARIVLENTTLVERSIPPTANNRKKNKVTDWRELGRQFFDADWYCGQNTNVKNPAEAFDHWWNIGRRTGLSPNSLFDHAFYKKQIEKLEKIEDHNVYLRFLHIGGDENIDPHPCFSMDWYRAQYTSREEAHPWIDYHINGFQNSRNPNWLFSHTHVLREGQVIPHGSQPLLTQFLARSEQGTVSPHPLLDLSLVVRHHKDVEESAPYASFWQAYRKREIRTHMYFDPAFYRAQVKGRELRTRALADYIICGEMEDLQPIPFFTPRWHIHHYGRVEKFDSALEEFVAIGEKLYRHPCPGFDPRFYLETNPDVARAGQNPLRHFITSGQRELRKIHRRFDLPWYAARLPADIKPQALEHWLKVGRFEGHSPHPSISVDHRGNAGEALVAFLEPKPKRGTVIPGIRTSLEGMLHQNVGKVTPSVFGQAWLADEFEKSHRRKGQRDAQVVKRNEPIARQFETFDDLVARRHAEEIQEKFSKLASTELPLVSVVVPTRNRVKVLKRAVKAILNQTYTNLELLVVDDGSLDNSAELMTRHFDDERIRYIPIPASGVSAARNVGIENATGTYIAYCDSDNYWEPNHLDLVVKSLILGNVLAGYSVLRVFNEKNIFRYRGDIYCEEAMDRENYIDMNVYVHHRRIADDGFRFDESLKRCVDWDFILRASKVFQPIFVPVIGCNYVDDSGALERITTDELSGDFYKVCQKNINLTPHTVGSAPIRNCRATIVWPISASEWDFVQDSLWAAVDHCANTGDELIIINNAMGYVATNYLTSLGEMSRHVRVINLWRTFREFPAANLASEIAKGEFLLLWDSHTIFNSTQVDDFIRQSIETGCQIVAPLVLNDVGNVCNSLAVKETTSHVLTPVITGTDAAEFFGIAKGFAFIDSPVLLERATFQEAGGFLPGFAVTFGLADLCLRVLKQDPAATALLFDVHLERAKEKLGSQANSEYQKELDLLKDTWLLEPTWTVQLPSGFEFEKSGKIPLISKNWELFPDLSVGIRVHSPYVKRALRFVLRCPAPDSAEKVSWGDYHYASAMKSALEKFGHRAAIEFFDNWKSPTEHGDVVFHIRGIRDLQPVAGALNAVWVISHPEKITPAEYGAMDVIFAGGTGVKHSLRQNYGIESHLLLQATDQTRFCGKIRNLDQLNNKALFVGNSRMQMRPIVLDSIAAGLPIVVYGNNWDSLIPEDVIAGTYIPNEGLADWYGSAGVVLNDHWPSMREYGIISNRIFDVVATGRPVITDYIDGLQPIFGDSVKTYHSEDELPGLYAEMSKGRHEEAAKHVRSDHTIEARVAEVLNVLSVGKR